VQEEKLVKLLCDHKTTIGWTLADIKGISPSMCMHHILLENNARPTREMQRRLNPTMMEVMKAEILNLLDAGVIYRITDSKWMALIHVVPKKTGITLVKNKNDELIDTTKRLMSCPKCRNVEVINNLARPGSNPRYGPNTEQCLGCRTNSDFSVVATV